MGTDAQTPVITPSRFHRTVNGMELVKAREGLFMNQQSFAWRCRWSKQYQSQIEVPGEHEISTASANKILEALGKEVVPMI